MALVTQDGTTYRVGDPVPRDCEECDCQQHQWNFVARALRTDPPSTCTCGHLTSRHRFRAAPEHPRRDPTHPAELELPGMWESADLSGGWADSS